MFVWRDWEKGSLPTTQYSDPTTEPWGSPSLLHPSSPKHRLAGLLSFELAGHALQYRRYNPVDPFDTSANLQPHGL